MQPPLVAALITASVSLLLAAGKIVWDWREKKHERRLAAKERLDKYRAPLLAAVDDLGRRLDNIRNDGFLTYLDREDRRSMALQSTLFRFAQYLGWIEIIYGYSDRLRFESDVATRSVTGTIGDIGWILAADEYDRVDEGVFTSSQLMLWREEQRAVGELMRREGDEPRCISFDSFVTDYDKRFSRWFATFAPQLTPSASKATRLAELHRALVRLLQQLDVDRILLEFDEDNRLVKPLWAQPAKVAEPTEHNGTDDRPEPRFGR